MAAPVAGPRVGRPGRAVGAALLAPAAAGWVLLWLWARGPHAGLLHGRGAVPPPGAGHDGHGPGQPPVPAVGLGEAQWLGLFVAAWLLMLAAMMLPTVVPLVRLFADVVRDRRDRLRLLAALPAGYLVVWLGVGMLAYIGDRALHALVLRLPWLAARPGLLAVGALALAGAYQFAPLKHRCLSRCRSPRGIVVTHWRGRAPSREAFLLGLDHGRFCVGCCWALMVVMLALGLHSLALMAALAAMMAVEKNATWGVRTTRPLGAALLALAAVLALDLIARW